MSKSVKIATIINIFILCAVFLFGFIWCVFLPRTTESDYDKDLAQMPELTTDSVINGDFSDGVMKFFTDTIYLRDRFKDITAKLKAFYGLPQNEEVIIRGGGQG